MLSNSFSALEICEISCKIKHIEYGAEHILGVIAEMLSIWTHIY